MHRRWQNQGEASQNSTSLKHNAAFQHRRCAVTSVDQDVVAMRNLTSTGPCDLWFSAVLRGLIAAVTPLLGGALRAHVQHPGLQRFGLEKSYETMPSSNVVCCWCKCTSASNMVSRPVDEPGLLSRAVVGARRNCIVSVAFRTSNPIGLLTAIFHQQKHAASCPGAGRGIAVTTCPASTWRR
jgi:hypothetical protein